MQLTAPHLIQILKQIIVEDFVIQNASLKLLRIATHMLKACLIFVQKLLDQPKRTIILFNY